MENTLTKENIPKHIAIIMDGNGRWAKKRLLPHIAGHKKGVKAVRECVKQSAKLGVKVLTLFAFSSENINRPKEEVSALFSLFLIALQKEVKQLDKANIQLKVIGDLSIFNDELQAQIKKSENLLQKNTGLILVISANYGGKWDIVEASKKLAIMAQNKEIKPIEINEKLFSKQMCLSELPEVDLLIRTSGEKRLSNFLLWQCAYSEIYWTDTLWPDFNAKSLDKAIVDFQQRKRNFGGR
ncbi:Undecaprenyl diphosphate synthase [hydrothermal vent metagenome]|uniref:Undecaprenyl diphosphate synthase n=1 Tax=hydrothermal vent metagenome TaxID=652676 RepID=A0A1W1BII9_9ZZZZ